MEREVPALWETAAEEDEEPCVCSCHLRGGVPVMVAPQPDAAEYGEPLVPVPCCEDAAVIDTRLAGSVSRYLEMGRWFILERTPYGIGMFAPCREDVLELIETLQL